MIDLKNAYEIRNVLNNKVIDKIEDTQGKIWYEAFNILPASGVPPITLQKCKAANLVDYKIYGNSVQGKLPKEYQQVEYIEGTGTQYTIIDYIATGITSSKGKYQITDTTKARFLFGSRGASGSNFYGFNWGGGTPYKYYNSYNWGVVTTREIDDKIHTFHKKLQDLYIDDELAHGNQYQANFTTPYKMNVFACNNDGVEGYLPVFAKLFYLQFYDNETLMIDLIPCYRKSDNEIGLYDLVNGVFYTNKGTGTFLKGSDTPTPNTPIEIESVGEYDEEIGKYKIPVKVSGKNLFKVSDLEYDANWIVNAYTKYYKLKPNTNYTCSSNVPYPSSGSTTLYFNGTTGLNANGVYDGISRTFNSGSNGEMYIAIPIDREYTEALLNEEYWIQLEEGNEASEYEPYQEPVTTNIYLNEPLHKIGDYADYIDFEKGKVIRAIQEAVYKGTENWIGLSDNQARYFALIIGEYGIVQRDIGLSTHFIRTSIGSANYNIGFNVINSTGYNDARILFRPDLSKYNTVVLWKEYLNEQYIKGTPVTAYLVCATPTEEEIELPNISLNKGTNIIEVDTNILPSNMEVEYYGKE